MDLMHKIKKRLFAFLYYGGGGGIRTPATGRPILQL